jgi:serine/threonine-protein kinase
MVKPLQAHGPFDVEVGMSKTGSEPCELPLRHYESVGPLPRRIAGKYSPIRVIGRGGMGTVIEARHDVLGELVAIKLLQPARRLDAEMCARFLREGRATRKLHGQHAVRVHDMGTTPDGLSYIVMERLEGADLAHRLASLGPLPIAEAVSFVVQACEGLAEAHALGLVHRDIKPSNLFVARAPDGTSCIKLLDFGMVKAPGRGDARITESTSVLGSPAYMSPEQIRSAKHVDARSDIWSLGVVLYELLAGQPPFSGETSPAIIASITADPPTPLRSIREDVPPGLALVIERCLEKRVASRTPSVAALADALRPWLSPDDEASLARIHRLARAAPAPDATPSDADPPTTVYTMATTVLAPERSPSGVRRRRLAVGALGVLTVVAVLLGLDSRKSESPRAVLRAESARARKALATSTAMLASASDDTTGARVTRPVTGLRRLPDEPRGHAAVDVSLDQAVFSEAARERN